MEAVIFDYDGTIGDCYDVLTACFNHTFRHYDRPELTVDEIRPWVGIGLEECLRSVIKEEKLDEAIALLDLPRSKKPESGAKRLRKLADHRAGKALLAALEKEVLDPRTWSAQPST